MFTKTETPNAATIFLEWPSAKYRTYYIKKNLYRKYIKLVWMVTKPSCWFRIYFNISPDYSPQEEDNKISWFINNEKFTQECLPYILFYDKGEKCYKGSIKLIAIDGSTGYCTFHLLEY